MTRPESQPRHPLALLADYVEAANRHLDAPSYSGVLEEAMNDAEDALLTLDPAALRAQAEAGARLREALNRIACAWTITANSLYVNGGTEFTAGKAAGLAQASESLTRTCAALAQAGGES